MLNDRQIKLLRLVEPFDESLVQPASLDVRLGPRILIPEKSLAIIVVGTDRPYYYEEHLPYNLEPGTFILCHTLEEVRLPPNIAAKFEGKSSLGRLGLMTHITAGFIDPGFIGNLTLEVKNAGSHRLRLTEGIKIGQIAFFQLDEAAERPYGSKELGSHYQNSVGVVGYKA